MVQYIQINSIQFNMRLCVCACVYFPSSVTSFVSLCSVFIPTIHIEKQGATKLAITRLVDLIATIRETYSWRIVSAIQPYQNQVARGRS